MAWRGKPIAVPTPSYKGPARIARGSERGDADTKRGLEADLVCNLKQQIELLQQERAQLRTHITSPRWTSAASPTPPSPHRHHARDDSLRDPLFSPPKRVSDAYGPRDQDFAVLQRDHAQLAQEHSDLREATTRDRREFERRAELAEAESRKLRGQLEDVILDPTRRETRHASAAAPYRHAPLGASAHSDPWLGTHPGGATVVNLRKETPWEFLRGWSIEEGRKFLADMEKKAAQMKWAEWTSADLTKFVDELGAKVTDAAAKVTDLEGTLGATKQELAKAEGKIVEQDEKIAEHEKAVADANTVAAAAKEAAKLAREEDFQKLEEEKQVLEDKVKALEGERPEYVARVEYYKKEIETKDIAIVGLQTQVTELEARVAAVNEELGVARHKASQEAAEVKRLQEALDKRGTPNQLSALREELERAKEEIAQLRHRESAAERRHHAVQRHTEQLLKEVTTWDLPVPLEAVREAPVPGGAAVEPTNTAATFVTAAAPSRRPMLAGLIM